MFQRLNFSVVLLRQPSLKMKRSKWGALFNKHPFALRHVARKTYHPPFSSLNSKQNHITWFSCYFVPLLKKEVLCFWTSRTSLRHIKFPVDVPFQSSCCGSAVTLCHSKNTRLMHNHRQVINWICLLVETPEFYLNKSNCRICPKHSRLGSHCHSTERMLEIYPPAPDSHPRNAFCVHKGGKLPCIPQFWTVLCSKATLLCLSVWCQGTCNSFFLLPEVRN